MIFALVAPKSDHRFAAIFFHCAIGMTDQRHDYRGYNINIMPYAGGLRATIYAPDSKQPMLGPQSDDPNDHNEVLAWISQTRAGRGGELCRYRAISEVRGIGLAGYRTRFAWHASGNFRLPVMRVRQGARQHGDEQPGATSARCDSSGAEGALKIDVGEFELVLVRASRGDGEVDAAHAGAHLRAELQQLEPNGRDGGIGELAMAQTDAAQGIDENIGHGRERHAELIGLHGGRRGAIGEQLELLANTVLGLAACAVELLVEGTRIVGNAATLEGCDDEARIGALERVLGLADNAPGAAPAVDRAILEVTEHARRLPRGGT